MIDLTKAQKAGVTIKRIIPGNFDLVFGRVPDMEVHNEIQAINKWPGFTAKQWDNTYVLIFNPSYDEEVVINEIMTMLERHGLTIQKKYW